MPRCLIVANQTLGGAQLQDAVRQRLREGTTFYVVVPATRPSDYAISAAAMYGGMLGIEGMALPPPTEEDGEDRASQHLAAALRGLAEMGAEADGEVGSPDPVEAVQAVLDRLPCDEILVSTLPPGISRWLRMDLVSRLNRRFDLPVTHVAIEEEPAQG